MDFLKIVLFGNDQNILMSRPVTHTIIKYFCRFIIKKGTFSLLFSGDSSSACHFDTTVNVVINCLS